MLKILKQAGICKIKMSCLTCVHKLNSVQMTWMGLPKAGVRSFQNIKQTFQNSVACNHIKYLTIQ